LLLSLNLWKFIISEDFYRAAITLVYHDTGKHIINYSNVEFYTIF